MPFQVIYKTTFKEQGAPTFDEFIKSVDPSVLVGFPGLTPVDVFTRYKAKVAERPGFISRQHASDNSGETVTFLFETDPSSYHDTSNRVAVYPFSEMENPTDETPIQLLRRVYAVQHLSKFEITVTEI